MQDRFKFRFYDKDKKIMIDENSDTTYIASIYGRDEWYWCIEAKMPKILSYFDGEGFVEGKWHKFNFALMQCTGLKDKNGKLIYELDYVRYSNNTYKVEIDKFLGISLTNISNGDTIIMDDIVLFNCEVIGNEFESNTKI